MLRYARDGQDKKEYGLSTEADQEIYRHNKYLANRQKSPKTRREKLTHRVSQESESVQGEVAVDIMLYYLRAETGQSEEIEVKIAETFAEMKKRGIDVPEELKNPYYIEEVVTGQAKFNIVYDATGHLTFSKSKTPQYPFTD